MTILENLQNSREFPLGISGTVDSREFPNERDFLVALVVERLPGLPPCLHSLAWPGYMNPEVLSGQHLGWRHEACTQRIQRVGTLVFSPWKLWPRTLIDDGLLDSILESIGNYVIWRPAHVVRWLDHMGAMCSRAWRALCAVGLRFNSSRGPGKARPPT